MINELHGLYAKRNVEFQGMLWHSVRPTQWGAEKLSGYAPSIVKENVELLTVRNQQISGLDKELGRIASEDPQA